MALGSLIVFVTGIVWVAVAGLIAARSQHDPRVGDEVKFTLSLAVAGVFLALAVLIGVLA